MGNLPDYKFVPEADNQINETCPIEILSGQHAGIVYRYGVIRVQEHDNDNVKVVMDIDLIKAPKDSTRIRKNLLKMLVKFL